MKNIAFKWGGLMFIGLTVLFLLLHILQLSQYYHLRILNGIIHIGVLWYAIKEYQREYPEAVHNYTPGVVMGMFTSTIGILAFSTFMTMFLYFNPGFLDGARNEVSWGEYLTPMMGGTIIVCEGIVISLISSYLIVRILDAAREKT